MIKKIDFKKYIQPEILGSILTIIIGIWLLIVSPIGLGDSGELHKVMGENGLYYIDEGEDINRATNFTLKYGIIQYANESNTEGFTTLSVPLQGAIRLTKIITKGFVFDIRVLSAIYIAIGAFSAFLIIRVLTKRLKSPLYRYGVAVIYVLIFCDIGYLEYFNSLYEEGMIYSFFLLSIGILLNVLCFEREELRYTVAFSVASFFLVFSKADLYILGLLVGGVLIRLSFFNRENYKRIISIILGVLFIASSGYFTYTTNKGNDVLKFHSLTKGALLSDSNPQRVLDFFQIDGSYALLKGESYYNNIPSILPSNEMLREDVYGKFTLPKVISYYLKNPKVFKSTLDYVFQNAFDIRQDYLGNFIETIEGEGIKSYKLSLYSTLKESSLFRKPILILIFFIVSVFLLYKEFGNREDSSIGFVSEGYIYIVLIGIIQVLGVIFLGGFFNIGRSMFLFNLVFDIMLLKLLSNIFVALEGKKGEKSI